jgi:hypothetical protein
MPVNLRFLPCLMLLAACAGNSAAPGAAAAHSPESTVNAFLAAARDTNLAGMAEYWGGSAGPAGTSKQPPDYEKRIRIMQKYLTSDSAKLVALGSVDGHPDQVMVTMKLFLAKCQNSVPFIVGKWKSQYLIQNVDVTLAGTPGRPCDDQGNPL